MIVRGVSSHIAAAWRGRIRIADSFSTCVHSLDVKNPSLIDSDNLKGGKASRLMPSITGTVATEDQESVKGQDKNPASPQKASTTKAIPDLPSKLS